MNEPRAVVRAAPKVQKPQKKPAYSYSYDHATGLYTMNVATLVQWLMDVEARAAVEKRLEDLEQAAWTQGSDVY